MKSSIHENIKSKKKKKSKPHIFDIQQIFPTNWIETIEDETEWTKEVNAFFASAKNKNSSNSSSQDQPQHNKIQQSGNNNNNGDIDSLSSSSPGVFWKQSQESGNKNDHIYRNINNLLQSDLYQMDTSERINLLLLRDDTRGCCGDVPGNGDCFFHAFIVVKHYLESNINEKLTETKQICAMTHDCKLQLADYIEKNEINDPTYSSFYRQMILRLRAIKKRSAKLPEFEFLENIHLFVDVIDKVFNYRVYIILLNDKQDDWEFFDGIYQMPQVLYERKNEIFVLLSTLNSNDPNAHYYPIFPLYKL